MAIGDEEDNDQVTSPFEDYSNSDWEEAYSEILDKYCGARPHPRHAPGPRRRPGRDEGGGTGEDPTTGTVQQAGTRQQDRLRE